VDQARWDQAPAWLWKQWINVLRMRREGVPVLGANGQPLAALSIAALSDRISSRLDQLVGWLQEEAGNIAMPARAAPKVGRVRPQRRKKAA
jgi:DNA-binding IclR family transcriptional regulator